MLNPKLLDDLAQRLGQAVPPGVQALREDAERSVRGILENGLARLDLVTREEFDIQSAVLARTRGKLERLERQVAELEARLDPAPRPAAIPASTAAPHDPEDRPAAQV